MSDDYLERDFDDQVYEDDYYSEDEELEDEEEAYFNDEEDEGDDEGGASERKIHMSYACEECDYRWDDVIYKRKDDIDDTEADAVCPMCGSMNVTQI